MGWASEVIDSPNGNALLRFCLSCESVPDTQRIIFQPLWVFLSPLHNKAIHLPSRLYFFFISYFVAITLPYSKCSNSYKVSSTLLLFPIKDLDILFLVSVVLAFESWKLSLFSKKLVVSSIKVS